jgi:hypothetical protein
MTSQVVGSLLQLNKLLRILQITILYGNPTVMPLLLFRLSSFKVTHTKRDKNYALTTLALYCTNNATLRRDRATIVTVVIQ